MCSQQFCDGQRIEVGLQYASSLNCCPNLYHEILCYIIIFHYFLKTSLTIRVISLVKNSNNQKDNPQVLIIFMFNAIF